MKKGREKGGGRKPQGEFANLTSPVSFRMPEGMRKKLEIAAAKSGRSMTQEILIRLDESFTNVSELKYVTVLKVDRSTERVD